MFTYKVNYIADKKLVNASVETFNDGIHDTLLNVTLDIYKAVQNVFVDFQIRLPESSDDNNYRTVFFRSKINAKKILQGVRGNFLITLFVDTIVKSLDFDLTFPMKKVRRKLIFSAKIKFEINQSAGRLQNC